jgi:ABC-2 type transport system ATP-binding protein
METPALDALTGEIRSGMITGLVGPDGAGETTLLRLIAGLLAPGSGTLEVLGHDPAKESSALHRVIGYMPQKFGLYEDLTVLENLTLHAGLRDVIGIERERVFERLLAFTDLKRFTGRFAGKLPARYFVSSMQTIFQAGTIWKLLLPDILLLMGTTVFFIGLTAKLTGRRME